MRLTLDPVQDNPSQPCQLVWHQQRYTLPQPEPPEQLDEAELLINNPPVVPDDWELSEHDLEFLFGSEPGSESQSGSEPAPPQVNHQQSHFPNPQSLPTPPYSEAGDDEVNRASWCGISSVIRCSSASEQDHLFLAAAQPLSKISQPRMSSSGRGKRIGRSGQKNSDKDDRDSHKDNKGKRNHSHKCLQSNTRPRLPRHPERSLGRRKSTKDSTFPIKGASTGPSTQLILML
ncbi:hypothetical protein QBC32DRAFT_317242 [Pseudoneurospora amorphoporcata]|uniref:Uncharacterized protein n=1 Tax=Pseudoneurospora amorphoporcata TaxID=241081 RepID=A0AAN6NNP9_9PEZI|nr:hypothetical protein QBC32DRAFT_317242 [Pseudoneurospora amorphoporcata]